MRSRIYLWYVLAVVLVGFLSAPSVWPVGETSNYSGNDWTSPGGDKANTRYSTLTQINTGNIGQLGGAWSVENGSRSRRSQLRCWRTGACSWSWRKERPSL